MASGKHDLRNVINVQQPIYPYVWIHTWKDGWMNCVALQMVRVLLPRIGNSWEKDGIPNGEGWGSVAQITRSFKKAERDEIRKVVTLNRIFLEPGKIAPVVGHWWIEKEGRTQWVQKLWRGRKETECDVLNVRRDEGRRCETNTNVDVKLR